MGPMIEQRQPYVCPEQIEDLLRRARYTKGGLDATVARLKDPYVPEYKPRKHRLDATAKMLGVGGGEELEALNRGIVEHLDKNPMVAKAYREMLAIAKLSMPEVNDMLAPVRERHREERERYERVEKDRIRALNGHGQKIKEVTRNYNEVAGTVATRFRRIINSLNAMARKEPDLATMDPHDFALVKFFEDRGLAVVKDGKLIEVAPSLLEKDRTWIEDFVEEILEYLVDNHMADRKLLKKGR